MTAEIFNKAILDRADYQAEKYTLRKKLFGTEDVLPMWVADMDLPTPPFILQALKSRLQHPTLGYTHAPASVFDAIVNWQARYNYPVSPGQILFTHNVLNGFYMAVQAFTRPGDAVLVQPPVYPPFLSAAVENGRVLVEAPLINKNNYYQIGFDAFEASIINNKVKLFLFCHPQNPSGRVWREEELKKLAEICLRHKVIIVSDEIHADMTYAPNRHIPMASLSDEIAQQTITLSSPGKTFNLGGLQIGYAIIANPELKEIYRRNAYANGIAGLNLFAQVALEAAYSAQGLKWRDQLLPYFESNIQKLIEFLNTHLPEVRVMKPEASYLVWLDFRAQFADHAKLKRWLIEEAKLGLNDGESFAGVSGEGAGFMRINLAVSKSVLEGALSSLKQAILNL